MCESKFLNSWNLLKIDQTFLDKEEIWKKILTQPDRVVFLLYEYKKNGLTKAIDACKTVGRHPVAGNIVVVLPKKIKESDSACTQVRIF